MQELYDLATEDLYAFIGLAWRFAGTRGEFKVNWYVEAIADHLEALYKLELRKLCIAIPPRFGKSSIASVIYPVWLWVKDPSFTILSASYGEDLAYRDAVKSRDLINSHFFQTAWGQLFQLRSDINQKSRYQNNWGGYRLATSVAGRGTGEGGDLLIIDDPLKAQEADSLAARTEVINWYSDAMASRWQDPTTYRQLVIHQRLHEDDLIGYLTDVEGGWEILKLPVEYEPTTYITSIGWKDPRTQAGELLAADVLPADTAFEIKTKKPTVWSTQYQQDPKVSVGGYLKDDDIFYYNSDVLPSEFDLLLTSSDLAEGDESDSPRETLRERNTDNLDDSKSYSAIQVWGKLGVKKYLIDQERGKWDFPGQINAFLRIARKYPNIKTHLVEKKSNGKAFIDTLRYTTKDLPLAVPDKGSIEGLIPIEPRDYGSSKLARFIACTTAFKAREVYFPNPQEKAFTLIVRQEVKNFVKSKHKDCADALSQAINWMVQNDIKQQGARITTAIVNDSRRRGQEDEGYNIPEEFSIAADFKEIRGLFD